jgi:hypothetical protein
MTGEGKTKSMDINYDVEIAEKIMGWKVYPDVSIQTPSNRKMGL